MADLPMQLQGALETLVSGYAKEKLEKDAHAISEAYRLRTGEGKRLLTAEGEAAAYAAAPAVRMGSPVSSSLPDGRLGPMRFARGGGDFLLRMGDFSFRMYVFCWLICTVIIHRLAEKSKR